MPTELSPQEKTEKISAPGSKRYEFIKKLAQKVRQDDDDRQVWKDKQIVAYNLRLGLRRRTNRPYPGAVEVAIPITDKFITKLKSMFVSVATLAKKQIVVTLDDGETVTPETKASAERIERALNNLIRKRDFGWAKKVTLFVDYFLENGHAIFKVIEKFFSKTINRTILMDNFSDEDRKYLKSLKKDELRFVLAQREEMDLQDDTDLKEIDKAIAQFKSGKKELRFTKREIYSEPTVIPERGLRIIVPSSGTETQRLPRITHDMWMTYQELADKASKGIYDKKTVESLDDDGGTNDDQLTNTSWATSEGISTLDVRSGLFNVRECQSWYHNEDKETWEKWVFTWVEQAGDSTSPDKEASHAIKILQEMKLPYDHGMWTYVKHDYEVKNTRWYSSRGVPEKIRGLHQTIEKMYNARLVRDELNNAPMWRVSKQLGMAGDEIRMRPGQVISAEAGEVEMLNKGITTDVSSERLEQQAKAYAEEYLSITDFSNRSAVNQGSARTATELQLINQASTRQVNMDISLFLDTLSEVANHMYLLLKQSVQKPTKVGGVVLRPEDFLPKMIVSWAGSLDATDSDLQMQRAVTRMGLAMQYGQPVGIVTPTNVYNMLQDIYDKDPDVELTSRFITTPEDVQLSELEEQQSEIIRMMNGFDVPVSPDDNDNIHLQVIEEWIHSPQGAELMKNPGISQLIEKHASIHIQSEQMKNGIKAQKAAGSQGQLGDPRAQRVATAAR